MKQPLFSGGVVVLTGILIVATAILIIQQLFHPFDHESASAVGVVLGLIGILLMLLAHIWLVIRIFEQSIGWGIASIFVPFATLIAVAQFWDKTKRSFVSQMVCLGIMFVGIGISA